MNMTVTILKLNTNTLRFDALDTISVNQFGDARQIALDKLRGYGVHIRDRRETFTRQHRSMSGGIFRAEVSRAN